MIQPEMIADYGCHLAECPAWNPVDGHLYWVDISLGHLYRYNPITGQHAKIWETGGTPLGGLTVQADGALLLFLQHGTIKRFAGGVITDVIEAFAAESESRYNDATADPSGRVFTGTMVNGKIAGRLYRIDPDKKMTVIREGVGISNGMGFSPDLTRFYHTDSTPRTIDVYDYDAATGNLSNRRLFIKLSEEEKLKNAVPDGMTIDSAGYIWSAVWDGNCLIRYSPEGQEVARIEFPARKVSSVAFGGENCADLYITTAGGDKRETEGEGAGAVFRIRASDLATLDANVGGREPFLSRIGM